MDFFLVIRISIWNQMHNGSAPWNNESVIVHWEDKWCEIITLDIGCRFDFAVDFGLPGKEVDPSITLRVEVWASRFHCCRCKHHITLFYVCENVHMCIHICRYCKYHNELCYKAPICSMLSCCHDVLILSKSFILNTATNRVIKLHGQYVFISIVMLVIGVIEHRGWCSPFSVTTLVKIPCKNI